MKLLQGQQHTKSRTLLTNGTEIEIGDFPIIYNKDGWVVYEDDSCKECGISYMIQHGVGENIFICQTIEGVRKFIPDFKQPKDKKDGEKED